MMGEKFWVHAYVVDDLELGEVELMIAGIDVSTEGEMGGICSHWEGVEVDFKCVAGAK